MISCWCQSCEFSCEWDISYPSLFIFGLNPIAIPANKCVINTEISRCAWQAQGNYLILTAVSDLPSVICFWQTWYKFYFFLEVICCFPELVKKGAWTYSWFFLNFHFICMNKRIVNICAQWNFKVTKKQSKYKLMWKFG